jgi:hypothetical protein
VLAAACAASSAPAVAQAPAASPAPAPTTAAAPPGVAGDDRIVCRSERQTTTRFPVRTCRTRKEWRERLETNRQYNERTTERMRPERYLPPIVIP